MSRRTLLALVVAVLGGVGVMLVLPKAPADPEAQVRALVARTVSAAERRDVGDVMDALAPAFRGPSGTSRDEVKGMLVAQLLRNAAPTIVNPRLVVEATATDATFEGDFLLTRGSEVTTYVFEGTCANTSDGWQFTRVSWKQGTTLTE